MAESTNPKTNPKTEETAEEILALQETPATETEDEVQAHWSSVSLAVCMKSQ